MSALHSLRAVPALSQVELCRVEGSLKLDASLFNRWNGTSRWQSRTVSGLCTSAVHDFVPAFLLPALPSIEPSFLQCPGLLGEQCEAWILSITESCYPRGAAGGA